MTVGYETAVLIISLALFGIYCLIEELWQCRRRGEDVPSVTILLLVQNAEYEIERLVRTITDTIAAKREDSELIIIDIASNDMTRPILARLAGKHSAIRIVHRDTARHAAADGITLARGSIVYVCDLVHRMTTEECLACLDRLAKIP